MKQVEVIVEYADRNLSAYIQGAPIIVVGADLAEIERNTREAVAFYLEDNEAPVEMLVGELEYVFHIDVPTFLNHYSGIFTKSALSRITGINERQLWHYAAGRHKPRKAQREKIQQGIARLTSELASLRLG